MPKPSLLLAITMLLVGSSAFAVEETSLVREGEAWPEAAPVVARAWTDADARLDALAADLGGRWSLQANSDTGTAHLVRGSGAPLPGVAGADDAALTALARDIVAGRPALFGLAPEHLAMRTVSRRGGKSVVWFQQIHGGVPVEGARVHVLFHDSGRVMGMGSDAVPGLDLNTTPQIDRAAAIVLARALQTERGELAAADLVIAPLASGEHRLAWRVILDTQSPPGRWNTLVDAADGALLTRRNEICTVNVIGSVQGDVQDTGYCDGDAPGTAVPHMQVQVAGGGLGHTDANGDFDLYYGGTNMVTVTGLLKGPWLDVSIFENAEPEGEVAGLLTPGVPGLLYWSDANARDDELDAFVHANRIHDFVKALQPDFTNLDYVMPCIVDRTDGYCPGNAWYDYTGVNFCREGAGYANTGEIGNVVYHEYGHAITDQVYQYGGQSNPASSLHEGNSDIAGLLMDDESVVGLGFYLGNCVSGIRNADNDLLFPDDMGGGGHHDGQIISGFFWDAYALLRAEHGVDYARTAVGQAWHDGRILGYPQDFPDQVYWTFVADDDDGDLDNGTPHHAAFAAGAEHHGFDYPEVIFGVLFTHDTIDDTTDESSPQLAQADIVSTEAAIDPASVRLSYRVDGGAWNDVPMSHDGGDSYSAAIPPQAVGSTVEYYLYAEDVTGLSATEPEGGADAPHAYYVAWLIDALESAAGWVIDPNGTDSANATGVWVHVDPVGSSAQPDDDHTGSGSYCWVTGQHEAGDDAAADDVDYGRTSIASPIYDLTGATSASVRLWRWYYADGSGDDFDVFLSNDAGANWTRVLHDPNGTNGWDSEVFDVFDYFETAGELRLMFSAEDLGVPNLVEAAVDDLSILAAFEDLTPVDEDLAVEFVTALAQNAPNPFNPTTRIRFSLAEAGRARVAVYDARGRLVKRLADERFAAGPQELLWDGRDAAGRPLASGVYLYRLETSDRVISRRMTLLK